MKKFTEAERAALIEYSSRAIKQAEENRDEIPFGLSEEEEMETSLFELALAALTAEPVGYIHNFLNPEKSTGIFANENRHYGRAVYTAPPVAALVLPSELEPASEADCDELFCDGYNACLDEVKRLNANAPAEEKKL